MLSVNLLPDCPRNYQYERQPPASFTHCNPVKTSLQLTCIVLVPSGSTAVTIDWYWSKNISECMKNVRNLTQRFTVYTTRVYHRITTDLHITSHTDISYYWCQVNDPSYIEVFISSNKAPVFDTGTMTFCNGGQHVTMTTCAIISYINTPSFPVCFMSTQTVPSTIYKSNLTSSYSTTAMSISDIKSNSNTATIL